MRFLIASLLFLMFACGQADLAKSVKAVDGTDGKDGVGCDLVDADNGTATLTCNGKTVTVNTKPTGSNCSYTINNSNHTVTWTCDGQPAATVPLWNQDSNDPSQNSCNVCSNGGWHFEQIDGCLYAVNGSKRVYIGKVK